MENAMVTLLGVFDAAKDVGSDIGIGLHEINSQLIIQSRNFRVLRHFIELILFLVSFFLFIAMHILVFLQKLLV
jgi:hypothetical protein